MSEETEFDAGAGSDGRLSAADWAGAFEVRAEEPATLLAAPRLDGLTGEHERHRTVDPLTILQWLSRPPGRGTRLLGLEVSGETAVLWHLGVEVERGRVLLEALDGAGRTTCEHLDRLGVPRSEVPGFDGPAVEQDALAETLAFAVVLDSEAPTELVPEARVPAPELSELPLDIYSSQLIGLLGPDRGGPLEAVWHAIWELSGVRWCVLNGDLHVEDVERIPYRQSIGARAFADTLQACHEAGLAGPDLPLFIAPRSRSGHCVYVVSIDAESVVFHDPWPGRSMLAAENNDHGVAAEPVDESWQHWRIARRDLDRVAYATIIRPDIWMALCGVDATVGYEELSAGPFFDFFNVSELARRPVQDGVEVLLSPGAWQEQIDLRVVLDEQETVRDCSMSVDRDWLIDEQTRPFALDLLKSFLGAMLPAADAVEGSRLAGALWAARHGPDALEGELREGAAHLHRQLHSCAEVVIGREPFGRMMLPCSTIRLRNVGGSNPAHGARTVIEVARVFDQPGPLADDMQSGYQLDEFRAALWARTLAELERRRNLAR